MAELPVNDVRFGGVNPVFRVSNLDASIDYYVNVLGFKVDWRDSDSFASVSRDRLGLFLCVGDQGHFGTWIWIGVGDVELLFEEYTRSGARIRNPPTNYAWALEMQVEDLDGNVLRVGSEPKENEPIGDWLDMHGVRWRRDGTGGWSCVGASAEQARALRELAERERRDDPDAALQHYEQAVAMYREVDEPLRLAHTIRHLGDVLVDTNRLADAEPCYDEALTIYRARADTPPLDLANAIRSMAVLKQRGGASDEALRFWQEAHDLYAGAGVEEGAREAAARIAGLTRNEVW